MFQRAIHQTQRNAPRQNLARVRSPLHPAPRPRPLLRNRFLKNQQPGQDLLPFEWQARHERIQQHLGSKLRLGRRQLGHQSRMIKPRASQDLKQPLVQSGVPVRRSTNLGQQVDRAFLRFLFLPLAKLLFVLFPRRQRLYLSVSNCWMPEFGKKIPARDQDSPSLGCLTCLHQVTQDFGRHATQVKVTRHGIGLILLEIVQHKQQLPQFQSRRLGQRKCQTRPQRQRLILQPLLDLL